MYLLLLPNGEKEHFHVAVVGQKPEVSVEEEHTHEITMGMDEMGRPIPQVSEVNGHTHAFSEITGKEFEYKKPEDDEIIQQQLELFKQACELENDTIAEAEKCERFYRHEQWTEEEKRKLNKKDKAVLTLNMIESMTDTLTGYQRQNRQDFHVLPVEAGDQLVADLLNHVLKHLTSNCNFVSNESSTFEDIVVTGRGIFNVYLDYDNLDLYPRIVVEHFPWKDVRFGPHLKTDLEDCEYLFKMKWFSYDKLVSMFPEVKDKLLSPNSIRSFLMGDDMSPNEMQTGTNMDFQGPGIEEMPTLNLYSNPEHYNGKKKIYRVLERWHKEYVRVPVIVDYDKEIPNRPLEGVEKSIVNKFKKFESDRFGVVYITKHYMVVTRTCCNVVLDAEVPDLAIHDFHIVPVYGKKYIDEQGRNVFYGKVKSAISPQQVINKQYMQVIDNISSTNNSGYFYDGKTFGNDPGMEKSFRKAVGKPGFAVKVKDLSRKPEKEEPPAFPAAAAQAVTMSYDMFKLITNVNAELYGQGTGANQSGRAISLKQKSALVSNEYLYDNLAISKRKLGILMIAMIQRAYTPDRIYRILSNQYQKEEFYVTNPQAGMKGQPQQVLFNQINPETIMRILNDVDLTKYDIEVSESPYSPTNRMYNYWALVEAAGSGFNIPEEVLLELADIPTKYKQIAIQSIMQQRQMTAQTEQAKIQAEVVKSQIAAQSRGNQNTGPAN